MAKRDSRLADPVEVRATADGRWYLAQQPEWAKYRLIYCRESRRFLGYTNSWAFETRADAEREREEWLAEAALEALK